MGVSKIRLGSEKRVSIDPETIFRSKKKDFLEKLWGWGLLSEPGVGLVRARCESGANPAFYPVYCTCGFQMGWVQQGAQLETPTSPSVSTFFLKSCFMNRIFIMIGFL